MTDSEIAVTIARIDERLGTMMTGQEAIKNEVALLHDTAIRFGNSLETLRQQAVMKSDCVEHHQVLTAMIPCADGNCKFTAHVKNGELENKQIRISVKEGLLLALMTIPIVVLTSWLSAQFMPVR